MEWSILMSSGLGIITAGWWLSVLGTHAKRRENLNKQYTELERILAVAETLLRIRTGFIWKKDNPRHAEAKNFVRKIDHVVDALATRVIQIGGMENNTPLKELKARLSCDLVTSEGEKIPIRTIRTYLEGAFSEFDTLIKVSGPQERRDSLLTDKPLAERLPTGKSFPGPQPETRVEVERTPAYSQGSSNEDLSTWGSRPM